MQRDRSFASQLSEAERQTLDLLLSEVAVRNVDRSRRAWPRVAISGVAVAALLLAMATLPRLGPKPSPFAAQVRDIDVLTQLSLVSAGQSAPSTQDVLAVVVRQDGRRCLVSGTGLLTAHTLEVTVRPVAVPAAALQRLTCPIAGALEPDPRAPQSVTVTDDWRRVGELVDRFGVITPDPRRLAGLVDVAYLNAHRSSMAPVLDKLALAAGGDRVAAWWRLAIELIASVLATPQSRAVVLALAAADPALAASVSLVSRDQPDILGRPTMTIRVPYQVGDESGTADLSFESATGALRQLVVYPVPGRAWQMTIVAYTAT